VNRFPLAVTVLLVGAMATSTAEAADALDSAMMRCSGYPDGLTGDNGWRMLQPSCAPDGGPSPKFQVVDAFGRKGVQRVFLPEGAALCSQIREGRISGQRVEVAHMKDRRGKPIGDFTLGDEVFMAFSLYLPDTDDEHYVSSKQRSTFLQLHPQGRGVSPGWSFRETRGRFAMVSAKGNNGQYRHILAGPGLTYNAWIDFVVRTTFGIGTGEYTVWRRDEGDATFTKVLDVSGVTNLRTPGRNYLKSGIYRDNDTTGTSTHYMATPSVARTFDAAVAGLMKGCP
jgi:Polysaccharide lyase